MDMLIEKIMSFDLVKNIMALSDWKLVVMWIIGGILIYLAIKKDMEPTLLLPMGFGAILVNLPNSGAVEVCRRFLMRVSRMSCFHCFCSSVSVR